MFILLFGIYLALFIFLIRRARFARQTPLSADLLSAIFILYAIAGCIHVWIAFHYYPGQGDIWRFFRVSVDMKRRLINDFSEFAHDYLPESLSLDTTGKYSGWSYLQDLSLNTLSMIFNFFSFDNIYINTLFFCFITFWGKLAFFKALSAMYPQRLALNVFASFLVPSLVFWTCVLHKEAILFAALGLLVYGLGRWMRGHKTGQSMMLALVSLLLIFLFRKVLLLSLVPAIAIWVLAEKTTFRKRNIILGIIVAGAVALPLMAKIHPSFDVLFQIRDRQQEFFQLEGNSMMSLPRLEDNLFSFVRILPYALVNGLLMPLPGMGGQLIYSLFGIESLLVWIMVVCSGFYYIKYKNIRINGFECGCLVFGLSACIITGFMVPFAGAIVRYRSILYPFLLISTLPMLENHTLMIKINRFISKSRTSSAKS